ncbi:MAG: carbohydrate porin [Myxococcota bacterium]
MTFCRLLFLFVSLIVAGETALAEAPNPSKPEAPAPQVEGPVPPAPPAKEGPAPAGPTPAAPATGGSQQGDIPDDDVKVDSGGSKLSIPRPIADFAAEIEKRLARYGWSVRTDTAFYDQYAERTLAGQQNLGTFAWRVWANWDFASLESGTRFALEFTLVGSPGLNYEVSDQRLSRNIGSISVENANLYPDGAALDELILKVINGAGSFAGLVGKIDLSNRFDTNAVANSGFRQFVSFALENNLSIPWSDYGGLGAFVRYNRDERIYAMLASSRSDVTSSFDVGHTGSLSDWYQMAEIGIALDMPLLGLGHYRLTPWHNHIDGKDGFGFGFNFDQQLGHEDVKAFFRFGFGDEDVTPVKTFVSGGVGWFSPFGRENDMLAIGVAWSVASPGEGFRNETLVEVFYRYSIAPSLEISPDLQLVLHPAQNPSANVVWVPGIRLTVGF